MVSIRSWDPSRVLFAAKKKHSSHERVALSTSSARDLPNAQTTKERKPWLDLCEVGPASTQPSNLLCNDQRFHHLRTPTCAVSRGRGSGSQRNRRKSVLMACAMKMDQGLKQNVPSNDCQIKS